MKHTDLDKDKYIYKYGKFKDLKRTLEGQTLGFSKLATLNDPFEAAYNYIHMFSTEERAKQFAESKVNKGIEWEARNKVKNLIDSHLEETVVTCFTKQPTEPLMWAHYADDHKGVCYCFEQDKLEFGDDFSHKNVQYSNKVPDLLFFENSTTEQQLSLHLPNLICTKSEAWAYEKEIRYFGKSSKTVHDFDLSALKAVIAGCRVSIEQINTAKDLIKRVNKDYGTDIKLFYAVKNGGFYQMKIEAMKIKRYQISSGYCSKQAPIIIV